MTKLREITRGLDLNVQEWLALVGRGTKWVEGIWEGIPAIP